jgi:hypothetical protein
MGELGVVNVIQRIVSRWISGFGIMRGILGTGAGLRVGIIDEGEGWLWKVLCGPVDGCCGLSSALMLRLGVVSPRSPQSWQVNKDLRFP